MKPRNMVDRRWWLGCTALVLALASLAPLHAQSSGGHRVVTHTRFQILFGDMEKQILKALQARDAAALKTLLKDEFQVWRPDPADPLPREEWEAQAMASPPSGFYIENIAVRALSEDFAIAHFVLTLEHKGVTERYFVADVWQRHNLAAGESLNTDSPGAVPGETWRLSDRYLTRLPPLRTGKAQTSRKQPASRPSGRQ